MAAQRLHAIGAPAEGYVIPASGIINLRDASGRKLKPPFNVGKGSIEQEAVKLELHIKKCLEKTGEQFLHSNCVPCVE